MSEHYTEEVVCPYCGYTFGDSWEMSGEDGEQGETDCQKCDRAFTYHRNISVSYSSYRLGPEKP